MKRVMSFLFLFTLISGVATAAPISIVCGGNKTDTLGAYLSIKLLPDGGSYKVSLSRRTHDAKINMIDQIVATDLQCKFGLAQVITASCHGGSRMSPEFFTVSNTVVTSVEGSSSHYEVNVQSAGIGVLKDAGLDVDSIFGNLPNIAKEAINLSLSGEYTCRSF